MNNPLANWKLYHSVDNKQWDPALVTLSTEKLNLGLKEGERSIDLKDLTISHTKYWESGKSTIHLVEKDHDHILLGGEIEVITSLFFNIQRLITDHVDISGLKATEFPRGTDYSLLVEDLVDAIFINNEPKEAHKLLDAIGEKIGDNIYEKYGFKDLKEGIEIIIGELSICDFTFHSIKRSNNHSVAFLSLEQCLSGDFGIQEDCYKKIQSLIITIFKTALGGMTDRNFVNVTVSKSPAFKTCYIKIQIYPQEEVLVLDTDNS